jgi:hypothetical protein
MPIGMPRRLFIGLRAGTVHAEIHAAHSLLKKGLSHATEMNADGLFKNAHIE